MLRILIYESVDVKAIKENILWLILFDIVYIQSIYFK